MTLVEWRSWNDAPGVTLQEWRSWNDAPGVTLQEWRSQSDAQNCGITPGAELTFLYRCHIRSQSFYAAMIIIDTCKVIDDNCNHVYSAGRWPYHQIVLERYGQTLQLIFGPSSEKRFIAWTPRPTHEADNAALLDWSVGTKDFCAFRTNWNQKISSWKNQFSTCDPSIKFNRALLPTR